MVPQIRSPEILEPPWSILDTSGDNQLVNNYTWNGTVQVLWTKSIQHYNIRFWNVCRYSWESNCLVIRKSLNTLERGLLMYFEWNQTHQSSDPLQFSRSRPYFLHSSYIDTLKILTHWCRVTHICVGKLIMIGSDNGLSLDRHRAIIWTNFGLLSIGPLRTYFNETIIVIVKFRWIKCTWKCRLRNGDHLISASVC